MSIGGCGVVEGSGGEKGKEEEEVEMCCVVSRGEEVTSGLWKAWGASVQGLVPSAHLLTQNLLPLDDSVGKLWELGF